MVLISRAVASGHISPVAERRARAPLANSRPTAARTSATPPNMISEVALLAAGVAATRAATASAVAASGTRSTRTSRFGVVRFQASIGPMAVRTTSTSASGTV